MQENDSYTQKKIGIFLSILFITLLVGCSPSSDNQNGNSTEHSVDLITLLATNFFESEIWTGMKTASDLSLLKRNNGKVYFGKDNYLFEVKSEIDESPSDEKMMINLFSVFEKTQKQPLYYRAYHHWTSVGSFLAYQTFIQ